tara:strand:+ start:188 stop:730 length:543 start_codon:yes stop_codon:yes gene_type:complete
MENKCLKCGHESGKNKLKNGVSFCSVCIRFAPSDPEQMDLYLSETIPSPENLEPLRKFSSFPGNKQKLAMIEKASQGNPQARPAFGYIFQEGQLMPAQNSREVEEIFEDFLNLDVSLSQLARKRGFSVNGLKKILFNFSYIGKIKFNGQIHEGKHQPIVSSTLFNHVQNKLEKMKIKNPN